MNTFIKLMITYFIEQQLGVAHEAAAKVVEQLDMSYALNKFQHELNIAKSMHTGLSEKTVDGAIDEIKSLCETMAIDSSKVELLTVSLKKYIVDSLSDEGVEQRYGDVHLSSSSDNIAPCDSGSDSCC